MNRRNIIIIVSVILLIALVVIVRITGLELLAWWASGNHGPVPFPAGTPVAIPLTSGHPIPSVTPTPTWGQLLRAPIAEIPGITWKTLRNDEYGFEMKYPSTWTYKAGSAISTAGSESFPAFGVDFFSEMRNQNVGTLQLGFGIQKRNLNSYEKDIRQKELSSKENLSINGADWTLIDANVGNNSLQLYIAKQGYVYIFADALLTQKYDIDVYMIKSFHFVQ